MDAIREAGVVGVVGGARADVEVSAVDDAGAGALDGSGFCGADVVECDGEELAVGDESAAGLIVPMKQSEKAGSATCVASMRREMISLS